MRICLWGLMVVLAYLFAGSRVDTWVDAMVLALLALPCIVADVRELKRNGQWF